MQRNREKLEARGPWIFENPEELQPGDRYAIDLRNMEYNGRRRWFRPYLPLDAAQITNKNASVAITAKFNGQYESYIPPNAIESFDNAGIVKVEILNRGSDPIAAGDIVTELSKDAYDADDRARDRAGSGPVASVIENFTGVRPW